MTRSKRLQAALEVRFDSDAGDDLSVREWLRTLLLAVWSEQESFNGKRPWGNSAWEYNVYTPLIKAGFIAGTVDEDGYGDCEDVNAAHAFVCDLIVAAMARPAKP
ncbi:MAG: hypothetical protein AB7G13_28690 [Lautropia sp.]